MCVPVHVSLDDALRSRANGRGGTAAWTAPEFFRQKFSEKSDVYSFAVVVWEILTRRIPWQGVSEAQIMTAVLLDGKRPEYEQMEIIGPLRKYEDLVMQCWKQDSAQRLTFDEIASTL